MKHKFALNFLMSQMWALDQSLLALMNDIVSRDDDFSPDALAAKVGKPLTRGMEKRENGTAVIHVTGVVSRYASLFDDICGGTSTQVLAKDFNSALADSSINTIVMNFDSPGGEAKGINELADMIYHARGKKKIIAYVGAQACSAAYWIASACDEIVIDATANVGSIGTVLQMRRRKESADDQFETIEIVSSQSPNKRLDPGTPEGRDAYQNHLDYLADVFIDCVSRNMAVTRDKVINDFGGGGVLIGQAAIDKGMAHRLGSLEGVIAELKTGKKTMPDPTKPAATGDDDTITLSLPTAENVSATDVIAALAAQRPDVIAAITAPPPAMALAHAAAIVQSCTAAGVPALSATLLQEGVTHASAENTIKMASSLKDTLAAAGLSGSFDALVGCINDPIKMVGQAIHEAKASGDESGDSSRHITDLKTETNALNATDIYAARN